MAELADARDLKSLDRKVVRVQSPLWAPKQNERVTIQIHTRLPFKISPLTLVVAIANANRRGVLFSSLLPLPTSIRPAVLADKTACFPPYSVGWKRLLPVGSWRA